MAKEIERKFLVADDGYKALASRRIEMAQGYLAAGERATVRVRIAGNRGFLTVKGPTRGCERDEWEYEVPVDEARAMLGLAVFPPLEKTRWIVPGPDGAVWEVDEFHGRLAGLTVAEIELCDSCAGFSLPHFAGREVTGDPRYYNSMLAREGAEVPPSA